MKKFLLFFNRPILGGLLTFTGLVVGLLDIISIIPSSFVTYELPLWIIILITGIVLIIPHICKQIKILYYTKTYTFGSFGGSRGYTWKWVKTSDYFNVYGYVPDCIRVDESDTTKLDPNIQVHDLRHCIQNRDLLQEYIMVSLYDKVENTKQTNLFILQLHSLEKNYSSQRNW